jgi:hypothetical protein
VYDSLDRTESPNFFLSIDVESQGSAPLSTRALRSALEAWLATLDADEVMEGLRASQGFDTLPRFAWQRDGWRLDFRALPKSPEARGVGKGIRPLGIFGGGEASFVDEATPLRDRLSNKGKAYGELDRPFVVAVGVSGMSEDDWSVMNALYGSDSLQILTSENGETFTRPVRGPDGYWYGGGAEWSHRNVSGVLIARHVHPGTIATTVPTLWEHPNPNRPIQSPPIWRRAVPKDGRIEYVEPELHPRDLFGLPDPWPRGERFPGYA